MEKFKLRELSRLTNAYGYTGDGFKLSITYGEDDDKYIMIENTQGNKLDEIENRIADYKNDLSKIVKKINKKDISTLNFMDLAEIEETIDSMKYYIREYHGLKGDF
jgi:flagellar capping protein FliD